MFDKFPSYILEYLYIPVFIIIIINVIFKNNVLLTILVIVLILIYYNLELFLINQNTNYDKILKFCSHDLSHLGDNIFNIFLLNKLKKYIEDNNIVVEYFVSEKYHKEMIDFKNSENIKILDFKPIGYHLNIFNFWNSTLSYNIIVNFIKGVKIPYDILYKEIYNKCLVDLKIPLKFNNFYNEDDSILKDYNNLVDKYKDVDILIINSIPLSNQCTIDEKEWDNFVIDLNKKYKIVTTKKVKDIPCTWDDKLTIKKIAAISTKAKVIIGINTGPTTAIFNIYTLNNCRKIYIFDNRVNFITIPQLENVDDLNKINLENLYKIINPN